MIITHDLQKEQETQLSKSLYHLLLKTLCLVGLVLLVLPSPGLAGKEPKKRVAVVDFENKAGYTHYQWGDLGRAMTEKLIEALINTDKFIILERQALTDVLAEQNLKNVASVKPDVIGRLTGAQALIRGVDTNVKATDPSLFRRPNGRSSDRLGPSRRSTPHGTSPND